jgi:hypothetical protein
LKIFLWVLKKFWFPILIAILGAMSSKYPWAEKFHTTLKKFK